MTGGHNGIYVEEEGPKWNIPPQNDPNWNTEIRRRDQIGILPPLRRLPAVAAAGRATLPARLLRRPERALRRVTGALLSLVRGQRARAQRARPRPAGQSRGAEGEGGQERTSAVSLCGLCPIQRSTGASITRRSLAILRRWYHWHAQPSSSSFAAAAASAASASFFRS